VALSTWLWPTSATGAHWQRPMQGARTTRTSPPVLAFSSSIMSSPPIMAQVRLSQTRTVTSGGALSSSRTMSKCA